MLKTRGILYKNGERYLKVRKARQYEVHHFAAPSLKIPALASPPPVAIASARHNYRAGGWGAAEGKSPCRWEPEQMCESMPKSITVLPTDPEREPFMDSS